MAGGSIWFGCLSLALLSLLTIYVGRMVKSTSYSAFLGVSSILVRISYSSSLRRLVSLLLCCSASVAWSCGGPVLADARTDPPQDAQQIEHLHEMPTSGEIDFSSVALTSDQMRDLMDEGQMRAVETSTRDDGGLTWADVVEKLNTVVEAAEGVMDEYYHYLVPAFYNFAACQNKDEFNALVDIAIMNTWDLEAQRTLAQGLETEFGYDVYNDNFDAVNGLPVASLGALQFTTTMQPLMKANYHGVQHALLNWISYIMALGPEPEFGGGSSGGAVNGILGTYDAETFYALSSGMHFVDDANTSWYAYVGATNLLPQYGTVTLSGSSGYSGPDLSEYDLLVYFNQNLQGNIQKFGINIYALKKNSYTMEPIRYSQYQFNRGYAITTNEGYYYTNFIINDYVYQLNVSGGTYSFEFDDLVIGGLSGVSAGSFTVGYNGVFFIIGDTSSNNVGYIAPTLPDPYEPYIGGDVTTSPTVNVNHDANGDFDFDLSPVTDRLDRLIQLVSQVGQDLNRLGHEVIDWLQRLFGVLSPVEQEQEPVPDISQLATLMQRLRYKFPFSVPWDLYNMLSLFAAQPTTPVFSYPVGWNDGQLVYEEVDLSDWDGVMAAVRSVEFVFFATGLAFKTRDLLRNVEVAT